MTPTAFAAEELPMWEQALLAQREAEKQRRSARPPRRLVEIMPLIDSLRTRADLLLAEAVRVKWLFGELRVFNLSETTTCPGSPE